MKLTNNTVLITGGGSGIGFEAARLFHEKGNTVIIVGRDQTKLQAAANKLKGIAYVVCDLTSESDVDSLVKKVNTDFPELNILFNNAGKANAYTLSGSVGAYEKAADEIATNFLSTIRLTEKLLPLLLQKEEAAIVNNTSITAFTPSVVLPTYSASKAALRSYTQSLRLTLQRNSGIKVFEVLPPLVDTTFSKGLPGEKIAPAEVAAAIIDGLQNDTYEIKVGVTASLYQLFLSSPEKLPC